MAIRTERIISQPFTTNSALATALNPLPTITIIRISDLNTVVNGANISEVGQGMYAYNFTTYDTDEDYAILIDGGSDVDIQYQGGGSELAGVETVLVDLDDEDQFKADVSALAIEANIEGHVTNSLNSYDSPTRAEATSDKNEIITEVDANEVLLNRILGMVQENFYLDQTVYTEYEGKKLLTSGRIRIYSVAGSVGTDSDVLATYTITSVWSGDELTSYGVIKQ